MIRKSFLKNLCLSLTVTSILLGSACIPAFAQSNHVPVVKEKDRWMEVEPNDTEETANIIIYHNPSTASTYGMINSVEDEDHYIFECKENKEYQFYFHTAGRKLIGSAEYDIYLYDETGDEFVLDGRIVSDGKAYINTRFQGKAGHTYKLAVYMCGSYDDIQKTIDKADGRCLYGILVQRK